MPMSKLKALPERVDVLIFDLGGDFEVGLDVAAKDVPAVVLKGVSSGDPEGGPKICEACSITRTKEPWQASHRVSPPTEPTVRVIFNVRL